MIGAVAIVVSQIVIIPSWVDARAGAVANAIALVAVLHGFLSQGPTSLHAEHLRDVASGLARPVPETRVTEADLAPLPAPVQRYLRLTGSVGQHRVHSFRVTFRGRMRNNAGARWMEMTAYQHSFVDQPTRLFYMEASMLGVPAVGYHRYVGPEAFMRVKIGALIPVVNLRGPELSRAENVALFNDMCVMAPATLIEKAIAWEPVDDHTVRARFTNAGHTIQAEILFNEAGELIDFWSDDKPQIASDGKSFTPMRWSAPVREYKSFGARRISTKAEVMYHPATGKYAYGEFETVEVEYNPRPGA